MSKRGVLIFSCFLLILILFTNILATATKTYKPQYGKTTSSLNFRSSPDNNKSSIIKTISKGSIVKMVGEVSDFYIVQLDNNEVGYLSKQYVTSNPSGPSNAKTYTSVTPYNATVNASDVTLRGGPSTSFRKVNTLSKNTTVQVIGSIDNFNLVLTQNNQLGMIRNDFLTKSTTTTTTPKTDNNTNTATNIGDSNEQLILKLINEQRTKAGIKALTMESNLQRIARIKAQEMVDKNYFSHTSPTYGSPFNMMQKNGITYKTAGENIAGNPSLEAAVQSWMNSEGHKKNILSNAYNYVGIGVVKSNTYGYIIVAMFIGK